jgi:hypothetical protein
MEVREPVVRQMTITLPYFEQELPALYLADGTAYIPVIALCRMLGLHAATHMAHRREEGYVYWFLAGLPGSLGDIDTPYEVLFWNSAFL